MSTYRTKSGCCPPIITGTGGKRPDFCEHNSRYLTQKEYERSVGVGADPVRPQVASQKRGDARGVGVDSSAARLPRRRRTKAPTRDWSLATTKKEEERCCRICKRSDRPLESAHILGREHDEPKVGGDGRPLRELWVHPDRIIPACGPFPDGCHGDIDFHRINYLPYLTLSEQIKAVEDAGGIAQAFRALMPVEHREEVERSAA